MSMKPPGLRAGSSLFLAIVSLSLLLAGCVQASVSGEEIIEEVSLAGGDDIKPIGPAILLPTERPTTTAFSPTLPTATDHPADFRQLTQGGCCPYPVWSADSRSVLFLTLDQEGDSTLISRLDIETGEERTVSTEPVYFSEDFRFQAYPNGKSIVIQRAGVQETFTIANGGYPVQFSPNSQSLAWEVRSRSITRIDIRRSELWTSSLDGEGAALRIAYLGGSFVGWAEDGRSLIFTGGLTSGGERGIWRLAPDDSQPHLVFEAERPRGMELSPDGSWLAFYLAFTANPETNGLWLLKIDGTAAFQLPIFGSYRWKSEHELLILSSDPGNGSTLVQGVEAETGHISSYPEASLATLPISNNDWQISPDGRYIVFRSDMDQNLWLYPLEGYW